MSWHNRTFRVCFVSVFLILWSFFSVGVTGAEDFKEKRGKHFIVHYNPQVSSSYVGSVLRKAETYYDKIADEIGYARYGHFWTWDRRARIVLYASQEEFIAKTGLPPWSQGAVIRDDEMLRSRIIVGYQNEEQFLENVLPHEISHLILRDFIGAKKNIPLWFDEAVAQMQEEGKRKKALTVMKKAVKNGEHIPFADLMGRDIRRESDLFQVSLFYAQSISMIDFLIRQYGSARFGELCRNLREGHSFPEALSDSYTHIIDDLKEFEEKWVQYVSYQR